MHDGVFINIRRASGKFKVTEAFKWKIYKKSSKGAYFYFDNLFFCPKKQSEWLLIGKFLIRTNRPWMQMVLVVQNPIA